MKIAIDIEYLRFEKTGLTQYTYQLVKALSQLDKENKYLLINSSFKKGREKKPVLPPLGDNFNVKNIAISKKSLRWLWSYIKYPGMDQICGGFDVFHSPNHTPFPLTKKRKIATIHDLTILKDGFHNANKNELRSRFTKICTDADIIISVSKSTKNDIIDAFGVREEKIKVVYEAASDIFFKIDDTESLMEVCRKHGIEGEYILYLGTLEPRKNVDGLIKAYDIFKTRNIEDRHKLVLAGGKGWMYDRILKAANESLFKTDILLLGFAPDSDLKYLLSGATTFVYPSYYEGFGLPVLEAMSCGAPVITSDKTSLPEVAGEAAILVDPSDIESLADAIARVCGDSELRKEMTFKGLENAKRFSWEKCARETLLAYEEAANLA